MKKTLLIFISLLIAFSNQSCNDDDDGLCFVGSGNGESFELDLDTFDGIALFGPINLRITQGNEQSVSVRAEKEIFEFVTYEIEDGLLEIGIKEPIKCFNTVVGITVDITIPDLEQIFVLGTSDIFSQGPLDLDMLEINISGTSSVIMSGSVQEMTYKSSGQLVVRNWELESQTTNITVSGTGDFEVNVVDLLDVFATGEVEVRYRGMPDIKKSGTGTITVLNYNS